MTETQNSEIKNAVNAVVQSLPNDVSWDEIHYHLYVRQQIEAGLADSESERLIDTDEMRRRLQAHKSKNAKS